LLVILSSEFQQANVLADSFQPESKYHSAMSATTPQMALAQPSKAVQGSMFQVQRFNSLETLNFEL
jgi:hypothetical protein